MVWVLMKKSSPTKFMRKQSENKCPNVGIANKPKAHTHNRSDLKPNDEKCWKVSEGVRECINVHCLKVTEAQNRKEKVK